MAGQDRRGFLSRLARDVARTAYELESVLRPEHDPPGAADAGSPELVDAELERPPVEPAARTASVDDLRRLCGELGLDAFAERTAAVARTSVRLTPVAEPRGTRLGGTPALPAGLDWPSWQEEPLDLLLQADLAELPPSPLPPAGTLLVFFALAAAPDGTRPEHAGACRVLLAEPGAAERERPGTLPEVFLAPSVELTLPADPPGADEDACDYESWWELRARLAALQGVELDDTLPEQRALHRLLGHPDSLAAPMEPDSAGRWRLLVQLSPDPSTGIRLPYDERLFVWIEDGDLRARRLDHVRAFVR